MKERRGVHGSQSMDVSWLLSLLSSSGGAACTGAGSCDTDVTGSPSGRFLCSGPLADQRSARALMRRVTKSWPRSSLLGSASALQGRDQAWTVPDGHCFWRTGGRCRLTWARPARARPAAVCRVPLLPARGVRRPAKQRAASGTRNPRS